uniref:ADP-ribose pyrophosphatase n=1 Tax=Candidatus Kentrum sp. SD TaxID=2126332 RepID=A0A451BK65_9GAMM|nr:MAG: ADP-ribose pyrophosphatase [Candidatus Kentron sp. SD]
MRFHYLARAAEQQKYSRSGFAFAEEGLYRGQGEFFTLPRRDAPNPYRPSVKTPKISEFFHGFESMKYQYEIIEKNPCYRGFFRLDRYRLRHDLFAGGRSSILTRECLERGHAAAVLLFDPDLDSLVMVEQFRIGAMEAPDGPWLLEIVAGIMEAGESAEAVARREAMEEAGCEIRALAPAFRFLLSPGGCSEEIHLFCGHVDARNAGGVYGLAHEGEDIRTRVVAADEALQLLERGKVINATTIIALQWFALNRGSLLEQWGRGAA